MCTKNRTRVQRCKTAFFLASMLFLISSTAAQDATPTVHIIGQMKDVMRKGELQGKIYLDTIPDKAHLYGIGPVAYLRGEILIVDGKSYKSVATSDSMMTVEETYDMAAPFFGYTHISRWTEHTLPDSVQTIRQLEIYLDKLTANMPRPFFFRLRGFVEHAVIHVVNLPEGSKVRSPEEAHRGQVNYTLRNERCEIIGFFSTEHKAIFTHHDTWLHMHLITADRKQMGHLDEVRFQGVTKLYLPEE